MEKGKGNCPCSLCISKTRVLQIPFRSFSSGEKNPVMWVSRNSHLLFRDLKAAAAAKSLQSCPTLCDRIDGSPPGSSVPGIVQGRILAWVAISFSEYFPLTSYNHFCNEHLFQPRVMMDWVMRVIYKSKMVKHLILHHHDYFYNRKL